MVHHYRVAFLGFSEFERSTMASYLRLAVNRTPRYDLVPMLSDADCLVADADHAPSVQLVAAIEGLTRTVFIGTRAPAGAVAWVARPIQPMRVLRELDAMVVPPAGPAAPAPEPAPPDAPPPAPASPPPRLPRVLLVDDSEIALRFLETRLQRWGLQIDRAASSGQALELLRQHSYELAFLDLELGADSPLDGLALCQHIKRSPAAVATAVVMVSAHHSELDRVRGALAGCDAYLAKPLDEIEMRRLLRRQGLKMSAALRREGPRPA
ncbi:MAG: response regulator [Rubrivivax sp.]|nr:response regulator [Rubrivivax sp.]